MFAVIKTGGKQYRVSANQLVKVEKVAGQAGDIVEFKEDRCSCYAGSCTKSYRV